MEKNYRQLTVLIGLTIFLGFFLSCNETKQAVKTNNENIMQTEIFQTTYNISARTKMFLSELENEISKAGKSIESFKPSEKLIESHNIRKQDDDYFISGFVKTNELFYRNSFEQINITFGQDTGNIITVQIPFKSLSQFLKGEGIEYFEISEKVSNN